MKSEVHRTLQRGKYFIGENLDAVDVESSDKLIWEDAD